MSVDAQEHEDPVRQERTDQAMKISPPLHNPRIAPRVIPIVVTVLIALAIIAVLFLMPR
ncbi:MAG: hypothetical protein ACRDJC_12825 [Thermomicrobiales bacterium]